MRRDRRMKSIISAKILILFCCFHLSIALPTEQPTRFTLNTSDGNSKSTVPSPNLNQGKDLLGRVMDSIRLGRGRFVNFITLARNIVANRVENNLISAISTKSEALNQGRRSLEAIQAVPATNSQPLHRETARLENATAQGILEMPVTKSISVFLESFLRPTPLVDGIREDEKYGNSGDRFIGVGRALVGGFESLSNFLNTIVDLPRKTVSKTVRGISESLNQVGARIIGLQ